MLCSFTARNPKGKANENILRKPIYKCFTAVARFTTPRSTLVPRLAARLTYTDRRPADLGAGSLAAPDAAAGPHATNPTTIL